VAGKFSREYRKRYGERITLHFHENCWHWGSAARAGRKLAIEKLSYSEAQKDKATNGLDGPYFRAYAMRDAQLAYTAAIKHAQLAPYSFAANSPASESRRLMVLHGMRRFSEDVQRMAWQNYMGGLTLCIKRGYAAHAGTIYDFSKFYPSCAVASRCFEMSPPTRVTADLTGLTWQEWHDSESRYLIYGTVKGTLPERIMLPDGQTRLTPVFGLHRGYFWDVETIGSHVTDMLAAYEFPLIRHNLHEVIRQMIIDSRNNASMAQIYKLPLNCIYGNAAQHIGGRGICFEPTYSSLITATSRSLLFNIMARLWSRAVFGDTDSIALLGNSEPKVPLNDDILLMEPRERFVDIASIRIKRYYLTTERGLQISAHHGVASSRVTQEDDELLRKVAFGEPVPSGPHYAQRRITQRRAKLTGLPLGGFRREATKTSMQQFCSRYFSDDLKLLRPTLAYGPGFVDGAIRAV
jgi:hypothetical protein